jgi:hypothetical protein
MDEVPVDNPDDLARYPQPLLRSQDRLSQELRPSCLPQLRPSMWRQKIRETPIVEFSFLRAIEV